MHPVLFHVGDLPIATYGVATGLALLLGVLLGTRQAKRDGLPSEWAWDLGLLTMACFPVGARLEYVRTHWDRFADHPAAILSLRDGGLVFYGGLVTSILGFLVYARWRKVSALALLDMMAPSVSFGHAIGRLGCLAAGCCYGRETSGAWSITFPEGSVAPAGVPLIPTQLHEAAFNLALGTFLALVPRRFVGQRFVLMLWLYAIFRTVNEVFRGDSARGTVFGGLMTNAQLTAVVLSLVAAGIAWRHRSARASTM